MLAGPIWAPRLRIVSSARACARLPAEAHYALPGHGQTRKTARGVTCRTTVDTCSDRLDSRTPDFSDICSWLINLIAGRLTSQTFAAG